MPGRLGPPFHLEFLLNGIFATATDCTGSADLEGMFCPDDGNFTCEGTYTVSQNDMDAGSHQTIASVSSFSPNLTVISADREFAVDLLGTAGIALGERSIPRKGRSSAFPQS